MKITSAGLQSEFIFHHFNGEVSDLGDVVAIRTPRNPAYWDGNKLVFPEPPKLGDFAKWIARFDQEFTDPKVRHYSFQWLPNQKIDKSALAAFIGYRQILTDAEWDAVIDAQTEQGFPDIPKDQYRTFKEATFARQGICRAFICHVSNWAFNKHPGITLMLHADAGETAEGIYKSVGYKMVEELEGVVRPPQD